MVLAALFAVYFYSKNINMAILVGLALAIYFYFTRIAGRPFVAQGIDKKAMSTAEATARNLQEGFANTDGAVDIHARIVKEHTGQPLAPKVEKITGVLESPDILDNVPLMPYQELMSDALPGASIPASAKARVAIYTPAEGFVDAPKQSKESPPKENPYLQDGEDYESVEAAMIAKGTDLPPPEVASNEMAAVQPIGPAAF